MSNNKVIVVGAGPGGLSSAMLLASEGYEVEVFEKQPFIGGRTSAVNFDGFSFDLGPTFLMMPFVLKNLFKRTGRKLEDYLTLVNIDPLYRLVYFDGREFYPTQNKEKMKEQLDRLFPGNYEGYLRFLKKEKKKYERLYECLKVPYSSLLDYFKKPFLKVVPVLDGHLSLFDQLGKYFSDDDLKIAFTFQAKYLGMSPWECPGSYSMISYIEHVGGIHHVMGGLFQISKAMAKVVDVEEIANEFVLSAEPSVYVQNPVVTDPSLAPEGQSALYVLAPVPNNSSNIDWEKESSAFREKILDILETRGGLTDLREHIVAEKMVTPNDWESKYGVYRGATFNLAHNIGQMLTFRPHNKFEQFGNCYLVGGGTHPGSGLPTIFESGRISAELILKEDKKKWTYSLETNSNIGVQS